MYTSPRLDNPRAYRLFFTRKPYTYTNTLPTNTSAKEAPSLPWALASLPFRPPHIPTLIYTRITLSPSPSQSPSSVEVKKSKPQRLQRRTQPNNPLALRSPMLSRPPHPFIPLPKYSPQIPRRTIKHNGADWHERSVLERGGQDAVFLREEEGRLEFGKFGAGLRADDSATSEVLSESSLSA